jgi:hypothetical protein
MRPGKSRPICAQRWFLPTTPDFLFTPTALHLETTPPGGAACNSISMSREQTAEARAGRRTKGLSWFTEAPV